MLVSQPSFDILGDASSCAWSSPKIFTSIGVGLPSIAEHVLRSCTNSIGVEHLAELVSKVANDFFSRSERSARLQADEDISAVLLRREHAISNPCAGGCRDLRAHQDVRPLQPDVSVLEGHASWRRSRHEAASSAAEEARADAVGVGTTAAGSERGNHTGDWPPRHTRQGAAGSDRARPFGLMRRAGARVPYPRAERDERQQNTREISTAIDSVIDSALKKSPTTPESSPSGANTRRS